MLIVHTNVFAPSERPVTPDAALPGVVTDAPPAMTVHVPVPTEGVLPARVAVVVQTPKSVPAFAVVGASSRSIVIVSLEEGHDPLLVVQTNVLTPTESPVTPDVGLPVVVTEALPAMMVQVPVPTEGVFPARVAVDAHTV